MEFLKNLFYKKKSKTNSIITSSEESLPDLESMTEIRQISSVFSWVFNQNKETATKSAEAIHRIFTSQTLIRNSDFYNSVKDIYLRNENLSKFLDFESEIQNSLYCITSMNRNGYIREEALRNLIKNPTKSTLPFLLFRLSDWVPYIRDLAKKGIEKLIEKGETSCFIHNHKIVEWLLDVNRADLRDIHQKIIDFIFDENNIESTLETIQDYNEGARLFIFKNLIKQGKVNDQIFDLILKDKIYLIRLLAVRNINLLERADVLKKLLKDKNQKIRTYAIYNISKNNVEVFQEELNHLLFDNSTFLRTTSRHLLSSIKSQNYVELYREKVQSNPNTGSIIGLSEVGDKSDLALLETFLNSKIIKQRSAALYAISNLDEKKAKEIAFEMLNDDSNSVKKVCSNLIIREKLLEDITKLRKLYKNGTTDTKLQVLKLLNNYGGWSIAGDFIKGINDENPKIRHISYGFLVGWFDYTIRLSQEIKAAERAYVLDAIQKTNLENDVPDHLKRIINRIPFLFK
ncbi:HEAT repeat domain-containing protein [Aureivirga sp. CE67]|uniref:HEAT repeat domain-containing protein n=1 Tax=Aureivirga sp. CE67 TaxID=1788983 RepID=UPI0018CB5383|nr:hypothetical protein [Aureivirga sp. CE67]